MRRNYGEAWREAVVEDEVRIATLERVVRGLKRRLENLEERVKKLEEGRS